MRYPDGGGLSAQGRARREKLRLQAAQMFEQGIEPVQVARCLQVSAKSAYQWRRRWRVGGEAALASMIYSAGAEYYAVTAQLEGSGDISDTVTEAVTTQCSNGTHTESFPLANGSASGGYRIAQAGVRGRRHWQRHPGRVRRWLLSREHHGDSHISLDHQPAPSTAGS